MDIENKVTMSLEKYTEMYDSIKQKDNIISQLTMLILNNTEINSNKDKLLIETYDFRSSRILALVKEICPKEYEKRLNELIDEEN